MKPIPYPPPLGIIISNGGYRLKLEKSLGDGARGLTYLAIMIDARHKEQRVVMKFPKLNIEDSPNEINAFIDGGINNANRREINAWYELSDLNNVAHLIDTIIVQLDLRIVGHAVPFLIPIIEYIDGFDFAKWTKMLANRNNSIVFSGVQPNMWFSLARDLLKAIESVHLRKIVHGDIWPNNIIIRSAGAFENPSPVLIDFGAACPLEAPGVDPSKKEITWIYRAPERLKCKTNSDENPSRWYAPVDLYAIGMVLLYLAVGIAVEQDDEFKGTFKLVPVDGSNVDQRELKYLENEDIKDDIIKLIRRYNPNFLETGSGAIDVIMSCIRPRLTDRCHTATEVLRQLDYFKWSLSVETAKINELLLKQSRVLCNSVREICKIQKNPVLLKLLSDRLQDLSSDIFSVNANHVASWRGRDYAINDFLSAMSIIGDGDECIGLTGIAFWKRESGGPNGRVLTMLKQMALRGASVSWLIVDTKPSQDPAHEQIIQYQISAMSEMCKKIHDSKVLTANSPSFNGSYKVRHLILNYKDYSGLVSNRQTFVYLRSGQAETLCIPDYVRTGGWLYAVRFWDDQERSKYLLQIFEEYSKNARLITDIG